MRKGFAFPWGLCPDQPPPLGWKAEPSSRAEEGGGEHGRKARGSPHSRRQSRFGVLPFADFDAILTVNCSVDCQLPIEVYYQQRGMADKARVNCQPQSPGGDWTSQCEYWQSTLA